MRKYIKNLGISGLSLGWVALEIIKCKERSSIYETKNSLIVKQEEVLRVYEKWMDVFQKGKLISRYFFDNGFHKVAIYGLGRLGKQLYDEMIISEIDVVYVIDNVYGLTNKFYGRTPCVHPESELPEADLIIITIPGEKKQIHAQLCKKVSCPVKSMEDILFVI